VCHRAPGNQQTVFRTASRGAAHRWPLTVAQLVGQDGNDGDLAGQPQQQRLQAGPAGTLQHRAAPEAAGLTRHAAATRGGTRCEPRGLGAAVLGGGGGATCTTCLVNVGAQRQVDDHRLGPQRRPLSGYVVAVVAARCAHATLPLRGIQRGSFRHACSARRLLHARLPAPPGAWARPPCQAPLQRRPA
jgi:hypothetical protein